VKQYLPEILTAITPLLIAVLGLLAARLTAYINTKIKNEQLRAVLLKLDEIVFTVVR
jgi:hypothetical protein